MVELRRSARPKPELTNRHGPRPVHVPDPFPELYKEPVNSDEPVEV